MLNWKGTWNWQIVPVHWQWFLQTTSTVVVIIRSVALLCKTYSQKKKRKMFFMNFNLNISIVLLLINRTFSFFPLISASQNDVERMSRLTCAVRVWKHHKHSIERRGDESLSHQDMTKTVCDPWSQETTLNKPTSK